MSERLPTFKQLEKDLSQKIKELYNLEINFAPQKVTCKLFSRYLAIVMDEALTPLEKSLIAYGKKGLIAQLRRETSSIFRPRLVKSIEETLGVSIVEILTNTTFIGNKTGTLVVLSESPKVRSFNAPIDRSSQQSHQIDININKI